DTAVNVKRLVAGPSAASAAGAVLNCSSDVPCTGKVTSAANGADPVVSTGVRGSSSTGVCQGVTGGVCQAVTNSGSSAGPDANRIKPLVQATSTDNATVTSKTTGDGSKGGHQQGTTKDQP